MTACFHLRVNKQWKRIPCGHARINTELEEIVPETCSRSDNIIYVFDKNYEVSIPDRSDWIANNVVLNDEVVCFTDGSRLEHTQVVQEQVCSLNHTISNKLYHLGIMLLSFRQKCILYAFVYCICVMK